MRALTSSAFARIGNRSCTSLPPVHSGHTSAVHATARFGSASRGDPLYEAIVHLGRLLQTSVPVRLLSERRVPP